MELFLTLFIDALAFNLASVLVGVAVGLRLAKWLFRFRSTWGVRCAIFATCWLLAGLTNVTIRLISSQGAVALAFLTGILGAMGLSLIIKVMLKN